MGDLPRVSILIVSWNALPLLKKCLPSVAATQYPNFEIVLADNASSDETVKWVKAQFPKIKIVQHPENWAFCKGNNEAIPHTTGEIIVLLNNDVEVPPHWLTPLVKRMMSQPTIAAVQPKILQFDQHDRFEYAGASGGFIDRFGFPFARGRLFNTLEQDHGQYDDPSTIFWASGAALMLRRSALEQVGLLDERFWMHMEEIDLCWRLWHHGWQVWVEPASAVFHIGGGSLPSDNPRKTYFNYRNNLLLLYKNLPPSAWRLLFPLRAVIDGIALLRALGMGKPKQALAIVQAYRDAHQMKKPYVHQRPTTNTPAPIYQRSIVFDYFLRGWHQFSQLPKARFKSLPASSVPIAANDSEQPPA